jgi:signal transduction histidine kinase/CheY-like chemotaxis protein
VTLSPPSSAATGFESLPVAAFLVERTGVVVIANAAATRLVRSDLVGAALEAVLPELVARWAGLVDTADARGQATALLRHGARVLELVVGMASPDLASVIALDITQREVDTRAAALESLGVVAGGIAHDFNNLLVGVLAEASAARETPVSAGTQEALRRIEGSARRMAQLARQLLAFAGRSELVKVALAPDAIVGELRDPLVRGVRTGVDLGVELTAANVVVDADAGMLRQIVFNLVANASDADSTRIDVRTAVDRSSWLLEVVDDGTGIPAAIAPRIFDPFFTTKPDRHGLGLSVVHGLVRRLGGDVEVESREGQGTLIRVRLPIVAGAARARLVSEPHGVPPLELAGVRVLVADDEPSVRASVRRLLERRGAIVTVATDGLDARARLDGAKRAPGDDDPFDLVIVDVRMPGYNGYDLLAFARQRLPGVPVVLMSGYTERIRGEGSEEEADAFLEKPFSAKTFDAAIDRVRG